MDEGTPIGLEEVPKRSDTTPARKPSRLKRKFLTAIVGISVLAYLATCNSDIKVRAVDAVNLNPDHISTRDIGADKITKTAGETATPTSNPEPTFTPRPTVTLEATASPTPIGILESGETTPLDESKALAIARSLKLEDNPLLHLIWTSVDWNNHNKIALKGILAVHEKKVPWPIIEANLIGYKIIRSNENTWEGNKIVHEAEIGAEVHEIEGHGNGVWFQNRPSDMTLAQVVNESFAERIYRVVFPWNTTIRHNTCVLKVDYPVKPAVFDYEIGQRELAKLESEKYPDLWGQMAVIYGNWISQVRPSISGLHWKRVEMQSLDDLFSQLAEKYSVSPAEVRNDFQKIADAACK